MSVVKKTVITLVDTSPVVEDVAALLMPLLDKFEALGQPYVIEHFEDNKLISGVHS